MNKLITATIIAVAISFAYTELTQAVCVEGPADTFTCNTDPPNPDLGGVQASIANDVTVNVLPDAEINTQGQPGNLDAIRTGNGSDDITITGGAVRAEDVGVNSGNNNDTVKVVDSIVSALERAIDPGNGADTVMVEDSEITCDEEDCIHTGNGEDVVMVNGSLVTGLSGDGIETANQDDQVTISDSIITGDVGFFAVDLGNGDDTLTIGTGAVLNNGIDCRDDFDTLIFAMEVPEEAVAFISSELAGKDPAGDSITINNIFYQWQECEVIVSQLVGVPNVRPIPTLSEWGLIAMAGVLGFAGLLVVRRRQAAA